MVSLTPTEDEIMEEFGESIVAVLLDIKAALENISTEIWALRNELENNRLS